jgi:hypothetical protein
LYWAPVSVSVFPYRYRRNVSCGAQGTLSVSPLGVAPTKGENSIQILYVSARLPGYPPTLWGSGSGSIPGVSNQFPVVWFSIEFPVCPPPPCTVVLYPVPRVSTHLPMLPFCFPVPVYPATTRVLDLYPVPRVPPNSLCCNSVSSISFQLPLCDLVLLPVRRVSNYLSVIWFCCQFAVYPTTSL